MANNDLSSSSKKEGIIFKEVKQHHDIGFQETDRRATGKNRIGTISFNEADELFRSWIDETTWPYDSLLFDPRVFTFITEKNARLLANKPKGYLVPRENGDMLSAKINNELLSYQWDIATQGGTMLSKWSLMDLNARKYGSSFAICKWRYEKNDMGEVVYDGPEMKVLNNRDIAHDLTATAIEDCNWFQVRKYVTIQDLENINDQRSKPIYKNLDKLKAAITNDKDNYSNGSGGDSRAVNWMSRNRAIQGIEVDPYGKDNTFKTIEIVDEYRKNRWITFAPKHGVVLRDITNPYKNNEIPIVMLRYYVIDDDLYGLSEIEPIKGLQKAINAILCQYVDEINQNLYSPIAIGPGVRQHTLEWGKGARWMMNNPNSDFRLVESHSQAAQFFNNTYSALVSAMMNAVGESSLGTSNIQPFQKDKTATEVKALQLQRNARDNSNQNYLAEAIKRQYMLWHSMNQVLLFSDPKTSFYVIRIAGAEAMEIFTKENLDSYELPNEALVLAHEINAENPEKNPLPDVDEMMQPKYPVKMKGKVVPKFQKDDGGKGGILCVEPEDVKGSYDFIIDVESMTMGADEEKKQARQAAVSLIATNPNVSQMLMMEGYKPKFKDLFVTWLDDLGFTDADRYFEKQKQNPAAMALPGGLPGAPAGAEGPAAPAGGIPGGSNPNIGGENPSSSPFVTTSPSPEANNGLGAISPKSLGEGGGA
jgi:hypothetical protein